MQTIGKEEFREFFVRRPWLHGHDRMISDDDYLSLKNRDGKYWNELSPNDVNWFSGFIEGWLESKK